jgi:NTP pyrophosphatase (non-canonical NTP hydrolase)
VVRKPGPIEIARAVQITLGDLPADLDDANNSQRRVWLRQLMLAAFVELGEAMAELDWKPWGYRDLQRRAAGGFDAVQDRAAFAEEMADVLAFCYAALAVAGISDEEFEKVAENKRAAVRERVT